MVHADERDALRTLAREALARRSFGDFCERMDDGYQRTPHTRLLVEHLEALANREIEKLAIFMPPRHGKTYHASERFPAWFQGLHGGDADIILASYTIDRARASSRRARQLFREPAWPFDAELAADSQAVDEWRTGAGGVVKAAGVGGSMTGFGADLLVIDDPIKDRAEANSATRREQIWDWYTEVAKTRLQRGGLELLMMTRWHEDDLAGRILESAGASKWTVLRLPARAEEGDPLGRPIGEALWPDGPPLPDPALGEITTRAFTALYQGRPTADDGDIFQRAWMNRRYKTLPALKRAAFYVDGAWTGKSSAGVSSSRSAIGVWGTDGIDYYLVHAWADHVEYPDLRTKVRDAYAHWRNVAAAFTPCVEQAASGIPILQELKRSSAIPFVGVKVDQSKVVRAEAVSPLFESGKVLLPESAPWLDDWIEEHIKFPTGTTDDLVDTTSGALARLSMGTTISFGVAKNRK